MPANSNNTNTNAILYIHANQDGVAGLYCNACSFRRDSHSRHSIITTNNKLFFVPTYMKGNLNKLPLTIPQKYSHAIPIFSALKIIHPITAKKNVSNICPVSFSVGNHLPSATWFVYLRFFPVKMSGRKRIA